MGLSLISFKGDFWRGRTTLTTNDRGEKRLVRIKNGLISSDGSVIMSFPGWRTLFDFSADNNPDGGYERYIYDTVLPVYTPAPGIAAPANYYKRYYRHLPDYPPTPTYTLQCRAKPAHFHFFEQIDDRVIIGGEARFRECPIPDTPGEPWLTVTHVGMRLDGSDQKMILTMSGAIADYGQTLHAYNGLVVDDVCFIDGLVATGVGSASGGAASLIQGYLDANVNGRVHKVNAIVGTNQVRFYGDRFELATQEDWAVSGGEVHKIRPNYANTYGDTPQGMTPYRGNEFNRIDDPDALTSWRINPEVPYSISNSCSHTIYPAYVANRQRDHSDLQTQYIEGYQPNYLLGSKVGISRREQRALPYRLVPEPAGDRIILAAPGYNCLFQIPLMMPTNPSNWPSSPIVENLGFPWFENDLYDKPRALGVPKARLIESPVTPAPPSPSIPFNPTIHNHMIEVRDLTGTAGQEYTWPEGTFRICITYFDDVTGEEGLPSEVVELTIPATSTPSHAYMIRISYYHPGYVMPECLAMKIRIYCSDADGESMGLYKTIPLMGSGVNSWLGFIADGDSGSAKYGFHSGATPATYDSPTVSGAEWRSTYLPIPFLDSPSEQTLGDRIDFSKPPLQSSGMPRGASSARYIRGTLISVGHAGVDSQSVRAWPGWGSLMFDTSDNRFDDEHELFIQIHKSSSYLVPGDGPYLSGFGVASRFFPDAYQGIEIFGGDLLFGSRPGIFQIDKIKNHSTRDVTGLDADNFLYASMERLRLVTKPYDSDFRYSTGSFINPVPIGYGLESNLQFFYRMFKGQVQVGDPGNPWRQSKAGGHGIQFIDPNRDDDGVAVFQFSGNAVICTRKETYFYAWHRYATGEIPTTINSDFGCIAPNSGVEFDGGLVWLSERGPVALGSSLQHVGLDLQDDFTGDRRRYLTDSKGMMRHSFSCHDAARGQVYMGLITIDATHTVGYQMGTVVVTSADDQTLSRAACNEILCWSYRSNSFTYWNPPAGLEVLWMRPIRMATDATGNSAEVRIAWLAADGRVRVLDDVWQDENAEALETTAVAKATAATSLVLTASSWGIDGNGGAAAREDGTGDNVLLRVGMRVEAFDSDNNIVWDTTIASADPDTNTVVLDEAQDWDKLQVIRIGVRPPMEIETTYAGSEDLQNLTASAIQVRYAMHGAGKANVDATYLKSDLETGTAAREVKIRHRSLGTAVTDDRHGRRRQLHGDAGAPEMAVKLVVTSEPQVRIADIALEV